jgi:hypothetical protein
MIVVHFVAVSALYPRIVISSLARRLDNLLFATLYTSFGVWPRDHYMLLKGLQQEYAMLCYSFLTKSPTCSANVSKQRPLLHHVDPRLSTVPFPMQLSKTHFL